MSSAKASELVGLGLQGAAIALIVGTFILFLFGASGTLGGQLRAAIEPVLRRLRDQTTLTRSELADLSIVAASALALASTFLDRNPVAVVIALGLWLARPGIRRLTREENRMLATAGHFSIDLMIGLYAPIMVAQFLVGDHLLGGCLLAVVVGLSWPAGGGGTIPGRRWQLATVPS